MRRDEAIARIREHMADLEQFDVRSIALFGSVARDQATPDSDVDVLVDFGRATFDGYMGLKLYLEDILGTPVDVATISSLRPWLRQRVLDEAINVGA